MKILHLATRDTGGSFKACYRLHQALQTLRIDSDLLLAYQEHSYTPESHLHAYHLPQQTWWKRTDFSLRYRWQMFKQNRTLKQLACEFEVVSFPQTPYRLHEHPLVQQADIIHLHWVAGFLDYNSFFRHIRKPIVWTLHDQSPFLGGVHYALDLQSKDADLLRLENKLREIKRKALSNYPDFHIVATSEQMLLDCQQAQVFSPQTQYSLIPCGLDTERFRNIDRREARVRLGLPADAPIILFVAESVENKRKGFYHFTQLMQRLAHTGACYTIVGGGDARLPDVSNRVIRFPFVEDEEQLALLYAAADLLVVPSLQEAFGYTVIEAFACGTPVVAYDCVGAMDKMRQYTDLFLAKTGDSLELAQKTAHLLANPDLIEEWRGKVRAIAVQHYAQMQNAKAYLQIYHKALGIAEPKNEAMVVL